MEDHPYLVVGHPDLPFLAVSFLVEDLSSAFVVEHHPLVPFLVIYVGLPLVALVDRYVAFLYILEERLVV